MSTLCSQVHQLFRAQPHFGFPFDGNKIPRNGIYVLFENGERAHGTSRIVRVGTHTGAEQLHSRLGQHFVKENKDRSIFRKNVGRALLNRASDPFLQQWEWDLTTRAAREQFAPRLDRAKQAKTERLVTAYMQENFQFCVWRVDSREERLYWEAKLIATIAQCDECGPSKEWLGLESPKEKIRLNGLWLVNELGGTPMTDKEFERFAVLVKAKQGI